MELLDPESNTLLAKLFRGFADPTRLAILELLRGQTLTVSEIVERVGVSQSTVSSHLACLRECGLVRATQSGRFAHYELVDNRVADLLVSARGLLSDVSRGIYECARYGECVDVEPVGLTKLKGLNRE